MLEIVSIHVPKCAGTTFLGVLRSVYGQERVYRDYSDFPASGRSLMNTDFTKWEKTKKREDINNIKRLGFNVVHGHFINSKYNEFTGAKKVAWIRDPVDRIVSHYFHAKKRKDTIQLEEFIEDKYIKDFMYLFLRTTNPDDFDFIGISEIFEQEVDRLAEMMGWNKKRYRTSVVQVQNRNAKVNYQNFKVPEHIMKKIVENNPLDFELYNRTLEKLSNHYNVFKESRNE